MSIRIAIVGAGMADLSAGHRLADCGHRVTLLEKSRGCGPANHSLSPHG